jgi:hypothetical protein
VSRSSLEVADIFRRHGEAWRNTNTGHISAGQLRVMTAIEACRTAALGGHVGAVRTARTRVWPTTRAATAIAQSVNGKRRRIGW